MHNLIKFYFNHHTFTLIEHKVTNILDTFILHLSHLYCDLKRLSLIFPTDPLIQRRLKERYLLRHDILNPKINFSIENSIKFSRSLTWCISMLYFHDIFNNNELEKEGEEEEKTLRLNNIDQLIITDKVTKSLKLIFLRFILVKFCSVDIFH